MNVECRGTSRMSGVGMFFIGLAAGAVAGGIAALLFAPKSGKETREMIRGKAVETGQMIQSRANEVKERVSKIGGAMRSRADQEAEKVDASN
jgi:gas vesicle protein